jgi:hypothetical protein
VQTAFLLKNFISIDVNIFLSFFLRAQISHPYERMGGGGVSALYTFIVEHFWTEVGLKVLFIIPNT